MNFIGWEQQQIPLELLGAIDFLTRNGPKFDPKEIKTERNNYSGSVLGIHLFQILIRIRLNILMKAYRNTCNLSPYAWDPFWRTEI